MSDRCEPPEGLREPWSRHWVKPPAQAPFIAIWFWDKWFNGGADGDPSPKGWAKSGYRYICPVPTPTEIAAKDAEIKRLQAENATLRLTLDAILALLGGAS